MKLKCLSCYGKDHYLLLLLRTAYHVSYHFKIPFKKPLMKKEKRFFFHFRLLLLPIFVVYFVSQDVFDLVTRSFYPINSCLN